MITFDPEAARKAIQEYNADKYKGRRPNLELDEEGYERFSDPRVLDDEHKLIDSVRFVGEDYGGAVLFGQSAYCNEATLIVKNLRPVLDRWQATLAAVHPLVDCVPDERTIAFLFEPFAATKCWGVWASKTLHFLRPDALPIFDSNAKKTLRNIKALGAKRRWTPRQEISWQHGRPLTQKTISKLRSWARDYHRFCVAFRDTLIANPEALAAARAEDRGESPSDLKLLDKILYQVGKCR